MSAIDDFETELKSVEGFFLDSWNALQEFATPKDVSGSKYKTPTGDVWGEPVGEQMAYFSNSNIPPERIILHKTEKEAFQKRNSTDGTNHLLLGRMVIVSLYHSWDEIHRHRIAEMIGVAPEELKVPIFGDLRRIRNAIIHNKGIFDVDPLRLEVVNWLTRGDQVSIDIDKFVFIFSAIRKWVKELPKID